MTNTQLTWLRTIASAVMVTLSVLYSQHPSWTWVTAVIAAGSVLGIHAIPAISQNGVTTMSEPTAEPQQPVSMPVVQDGSLLMGLGNQSLGQPMVMATEVQPAPEQPQEQPQQDTQPVQVAEPAEPAQVAPNAPVQRTSPVDEPLPSLATRLRALADEVENLGL